MSRRLRSILVGLDGSPQSEAATELGIDWIRHSNGLLVGIGIIDAAAICSAKAVPVGAIHFKEKADQARLHQASRQVEGFLDHFSKRCVSAGVSCKLLEEFGPPREGLLLEAQRYDLLLLGNRDRPTSTSETAEPPGRTLHAILKDAPRPVVAVPEDPRRGDSVLIGYDGSLQAARALYAFWAAGIGHSQKIRIVSIAREHTEAAKCAERAVEFLAFHDIRAESTPIASTAHPAEVLLDAERRFEASLVVMGAYGKPTLKEFFVGSVTRRILKEAGAPLFLHH